MPHSFVICIDESGDQGFTFSGENCSSEWFVLSAVIIPVNNIAKIQNAISEMKILVACPAKKPLHFKSLKRKEDRRIVIQKIADMKDVFRVVVVMIHKPCLESPESFNEGNRLYFYFTRYLLERVSAVCAKSAEFRHKKLGDGTAKVIFSSMNEICRKSVAAYFDQLKKMETTINWDIISSSQFESLSPNRNAGLQVADSVAAAFFCTEHPCVRHRTCEWVGLLKPTMFRNERGAYRGFGLKLFPSSLEKQVAQGLRSSWAINRFPK